MGFQPFPAQKQGSRKLNRLRLGVPATLELTHEKRNCEIDDISMAGARLKIDRPLAPGQGLILSFHELRAFATVVWVRGNNCGLRFDPKLDPEDMQGMLWIKENRAEYDKMFAAS